MSRGHFSKLFAGLAILTTLSACAAEDASELPNIELTDVEGVDIEESVEECELVYELPDGQPYALQAHTFHEPESIVGMVQDYMASIPPLLLFTQGMTDGENDDVTIVGGVGERTGFGFDDTPDTEEDTYAMYYGSINPDTCEFQARLNGTTVDYYMEAYADRLAIDLSGFSSVTEGISLVVEDVTLSGEFDASLGVVDEVILEGILSDEGLDDLLVAAKEQTGLAISRDQAMDLLDPDDTGEIYVKLGLAGHRVVVDGFMDAQSDVEIEPRVEEPCCPDGLEVGDSVIPHLLWEEQGVDDDQLEMLLLARDQFEGDPNIAMFVTAVRQEDDTIHYHAYAGGAVAPGMVVFSRHAGDDGDAPRFEIVEQSGVNPLANTDPTVLSDYESFIGVGTNPNDVTYPDKNYFADDPRLAFIPPEEMHYPFAMERIAHNFDDPRTGDLIIIPATWSTGGFGTHGNLGAAQSRSPLLAFGPGIRSAADGPDDDATVETIDGGETLIIEEAVRQVDIAPTVAAALGVDKTTGVGPDMRLRDDVYLSWQDGRVIEELFTDDALAAIEAGEPVADHAVIIINDGLTNLEILHQTLSDDPEFDVGSYREFMRRGLALRYGSISNFPSNTYPGHNTIGSGAWGGHHGIVDNGFWSRELGVEATPITDLFETEYLMGSAHPNLPVETLHEAMVRTYGSLSDGVLAGASINDPSSRGAEFSTLERRSPGGFDSPDQADVVYIDGEEHPLPMADLEDYGGVMDNGSLQTFAGLYLDHQERGEEGLPMPKFSIVNFGSTDVGGHAHGPHGDHERYEVISRVNQRMETMLAVLEHLDIDDSTLVILTSDHGMELQDSSRMSSRGRALTDSDIRFRKAGWYYYFTELSANLENIDEQGDDAVFSFRVVDRGTANSEEPIGVSNVDISVVSGGDGDTVFTDSDGYAEITVTPDGAIGDVLFEFESPQWNVLRERFPE